MAGERFEATDRSSQGAPESTRATTCWRVSAHQCLDRKKDSQLEAHERRATPARRMAKREGLWGCESNPRVATMGQPALWSARPMQPPQWGRSLCSSRCLLQICKDLWSSLRIGRGELAEDNSVHVTRAIRTHAFVDALPIVKRPRFAGALALLCYPLLALLVLGKVPDARGVAGLLDLGLRIDYVSLRQSGSESIDGAEIERFTRVARRRRLRRVHTISRDDAALSRLEAKGDPSAALNVTTNKFRFDSLPFPWPTRCGDSLELRQARLFGRGRVRWVLELYRTTTSCPSLS